jgi:energy-coupling factor transport system ATP-binding protein
MIEVNNLIFEYPSQDGNHTRVLDNISFTIPEGASIALMGSNGSGKTTLVQCLNGLLQPSSGDVVVDGLDSSEEHNLLNIRRKVGMVFQNPDNQIVSATVEREVAFGLENLGVDYDSMQRIVAEMLVRFDLEDYRTHPPHLLSGGEKQRLALAAVLAMRPKYLIIDEPTSLLDPKSRREILGFLDELHTNGAAQTDHQNIATVLVTQFPEEALAAERLVVMHAGKIVMDAAPGDIFEHGDELEKIGLEPPAEYKIDAILESMDWLD